MARATVFQNCQIGVEATPGTPVAATAKLIETYINPRPELAINAYRPAGSQFATAAVRGKEYTIADIEGALSYTEIGYLLGSLLGKGTAGAYKPSAFAEDAFDTLTVETGSSGRAEQFAYGVVSALRFRFTKEEASVSGQMFGRTLAENHTITPSLSPVTKATVNPDKVQVLIGESVAALAEVDTFMEAECNIAKRYSPLFTLDADQPSFTGVVPLAPELTAQLVIPHEAEASGYMTALRAASTRFCRIISEETVGLVNYKFQVTFPFIFTGNPRGDQDDVYASTFDLAPIYDPTFEGAIEIVVANS